MTKEEVYELIGIIGKDYNDFKPNEEETRVWVNELANTNKEVIYLKYEEHKKNADYKKYPPKLDYFRYIKEDKPQTEFLMKCHWCGKLLYDKAMIKHEDRHRNIEHIERNIKKYFGKDLKNKRELENMSDKEFDSKELEFTKKLLPKMPDNQEKRSLINYVYLSEHPNEKITPDEIYKNFKIGGNI